MFSPYLWREDYGKGKTVGGKSEILAGAFKAWCHPPIKRLCQQKTLLPVLREALFSKPSGILG
jgi:hypothetical protein